MAYQIDIESNSQSQQIPALAELERWIGAALHSQKLEDAEVSLYIVDEDESQQLNSQYRSKDYPTNVLSFPADIPEEVGVPLLGDLVVCAPVVEREAQEQGKTLAAHWAHMLVHGSLHLLGFDHIDDTEADEMEALETAIITGLGYPAPYNELTAE
ncbi:putative metalloprotease [Cellvibrio sp. BR]|jgi:probable rRNA maturation factor|uniref:rRNA maturation RNase YbeY n=1 Tax=unclassified Cellvibrio TaxID=2624793 RepID=UPI00026013C3|nr:MULTISPECIES: rRNA maturation RNase YbeY [unclassified Cellvibrio]EIK45305.1 putative metalloprotease [Cellvibrio sp. BR]UUA73304.1 rRNA maturation RNase YbeY [Cellvibrio sp. QJXJ]